jgi:hypothetical protein
MADTPQDADHLQYVTSPEYTPQDESRSAISDPRFRQFPQITSYSPLQGQQGSTISVYIQSPNELRASPSISISMLFASKRVECALQNMSDPNISPKQYVVAAEVPPFTSTGWHAFDVPLRMMMESTNTSIPPMAVEVGAFTYTGQTSQKDSFRKRRLSSDSEDALQRPNKKSSIHQLHQDKSYENAVYTASPYSPFESTPTSTSVQQTDNLRQTSPRPSGHKYSASVASAASVKAQSPHTPPSWSPSFTPVNHASSAPKSSATPATKISADASTGKDSVPALIRTSTIQQSSMSMNPAVTSQSFNPYAMYPSKAILKLNGDLDGMAEGWSLEEWDAKRRLVQFTRRQNGSTIHTDFKAVAPEDRQPNSICISCIWWEEKKDCYVTSVDTIFLLESLVAVRFTVEEKNRIRRNLEGFRPLTVSKSKQDSEEFFKIIMGFPSPKPRNIEKDVKVFPWKILAHALKKIIGKYSASYSSTAGALPTPIGSNHTSIGASESGTDARASASPQLNGTNPGASPYPMSSSSFSPHIPQQGVSVPITSGPPTDLRLQVPAMAQGYSYPATHSHQHIPQFPPAYRRSPQPMTAPPAAGRIIGAWEGSEFTTFENGTQGDAYNYNRILGNIPTSQGYMPPTSYSISHSGM